MKTHQYNFDKMLKETKIKQISTLIALGLLFLMAAPVSHAQEQQEQEEAQQVYTMPKWLFGIAGAANFNFYEGTTRHLSADSYMEGPFMAPAAFHEGSGIKPYGAALIEYRLNDMWGINLNFGYDGRGGLWDEIMAPCDCPSELETNLSYLVFEPSLKFAPFRKNFHIFAGPRLSYIYTKDFTYQREQQFLPDYWTHEAEMHEMNDLLISMQVGAGYDIVLSKPGRQAKWMLTPFVSFHPYFGQEPRGIETWSITTVRAGLALKVGRGVPVPLPAPDPEPDPLVEEIEPEEPEITEPPVVFTATAPLPEVTVTSHEIYPLRNYIFFAEGNSNIPDRYTKLSHTEAGRFSAEEMSNRPDIRRDNKRDNQMIVYYNILNVIGDRMRNNPGSTITLNGSSAGQGVNVGLQQAESVKEYLVSVIGIDAQRITTRGSDWPQTRSFRHDQQTEVDLRLDSDRRVEIWTASSELLMREKGRESGTLKPVMISWPDTDLDKDHITFTLSNAERYMKEWHVVLTDPNGEEFEYGPFTSSHERVSAYELLEQGAEGVYQVVMKGLSRDDLEFYRESTMELRLDLLEHENVTRFSVLFDIDMFNIPPVYENYLITNVAPFVSDEAKVVIRGHTDIIGNADHNKALSLQRAQRAKTVIEAALKSYGINNVEFEVHGFGELPEEAPYPNQLPDQRFHNRTVIIDITPR